MNTELNEREDRTIASTYQKWVDELGIEGAKEKMREIGRNGGKKGGGKAGFHTIPRTELRKISARGGRSPRRKKDAV